MHCGGWARANGASYAVDRCYVYEFASNSWKVGAQLPSKGYYFGADYHPSWGLVFTGGKYYNNYFDSVLITKDGYTLREVTKMPVAMAYHCGVIIEADMLFVTGGLQAGDVAQRETFLYQNRSVN